MLKFLDYLEVIKRSKNTLIGNQNMWEKKVFIVL